eukprot:TRINITY_DN62123_c0_g1_i1.p1 TRINITY_DN62123_c0_g1~~TRINITY_DN62123_c0_g1_i1.p1  ORF type:complete len:228 (-),score=20.64 TRINITY_DN62123_c0_g1_i1:29-712(-)
MPRSRSRDRSRRSRSRRSRSHRSSSRRSRSRRRSRDRRDDRRSRSRERKKSPYKSSRREIPPRAAAPPKAVEPDEGVTLEQRQHSVECDGRLYACIDFTAPGQLPESVAPTWQADPSSGSKQFYQQNESSKGLEWGTVPPGWELAPASESVTEKVIKPHPWGTHLIVTLDSKAYHTSSSNRPGSLEMLWDYEKDRSGKGFRLEKKVGMNSKWHGRLLIRTKLIFTSS